MLISRFDNRLKTMESFHAGMLPLTKSCQRWRWNAGFLTQSLTRQGTRPSRLLLLLLRRLLFLLSLLSFFFSSSPALADITLPTSIGGISLPSELTNLKLPDVNTLIPEAAVTGIIQIVGIGMNHRAYEPAASLGTSPGFSFGIEATLVHPSTALNSYLSSSFQGVTLPIIPSARLHLRKGISNRLELGLSVLPAPTTLPYIGSTLLIGGDLKYVVWEDTEEGGVTVALRGSYNVNSLAVSYSTYSFTMNTTTLSPQLVISKKLSFAQPYIGAGYQYTTGQFSLSIPLNKPPLSNLIPNFQTLSSIPTINNLLSTPVVVTLSGQASEYHFFGGISLLVPYIDLQIVLEGAYSPSGMNYLGTKVGFQF